MATIPASHVFSSSLCLPFNLLWFPLPHVTHSLTLSLILQAGLVRSMAEMKVSGDSASASSDSAGASTSLSSRKEAWETGNVDYLGSEAYENIEKNLDSKLK